MMVIRTKMTIATRMVTIITTVITITIADIGIKTKAASAFGLTLAE